ncbi:hypothetical protein E2562_025973 [Oryza meyeriana var. granulata]|uniref:Uncharacterized protein n=1 Tax=Oryza meyeriana var. granulata TaxID=110450 RepID=A0A6G1EZ14_9ORYZ|nr:hypothetical protein E2562_025973 [Oryza meyeriana var. granulata]
MDGDSHDRTGSALGYARIDWTSEAAAARCCVCCDDFIYEICMKIIEIIGHGERSASKVA